MFNQQRAAMSPTTKTALAILDALSVYEVYTCQQIGPATILFAPATRRKGLALKTRAIVAHDRILCGTAIRGRQ